MWYRCSNLGHPDIPCHNTFTWRSTVFMKGYNIMFLTVNKRSSSVPWKKWTLVVSPSHFYHVHDVHIITITEFIILSMTIITQRYRANYLIFYFEITKYTPHICCYCKALCIVCVVNFDTFTIMWPCLQIILVYSQFPLISFVQVRCFFSKHRCYLLYIMYHVLIIL